MKERILNSLRVSSLVLAVPIITVLAASPIIISHHYDSYWYLIGFIISIPITVFILYTIDDLISN